MIFFSKSSAADGSSPVPKVPSMGRTRRIHMVGIGGIGMSGIAEILLLQGYEVSGSDGARGENIERLERMGARIAIGHRAENVGDADVVVYTSAVRAEDNVETREAMRRRIPVIKRAEMLAEMMRMKFGIGVAGTHGKTTTTSMLGQVLREGGLDPTIIVGGRVHSFDRTNAVVGRGDILVVEADEYDRTFLKLTPSMAVVTNIEAEHLDIYRDEDDVRQAFAEFAGKVPFYGAAAVCLDDPGVRWLLPRLERRVVTYGLTPQAELRGEILERSGFGTRFRVWRHQAELGTVRLQVPGEHNVRNALGAAAIALELGVPFEKVRAGLEAFDGVYRRFQLKMEAGGVLLVDDYAHHPTEVRAALAGAKRGWPERRVVAVFQPHLYSRTQQMADAFGHAFLDADVLVVTDVYPSREKPVEGVSGQLIADKAEELGHRHVIYQPDKQRLPEELLALVKSGDLVITMGAGDIYRFGERFADLWRAQYAGDTGAERHAGGPS